TSTGRTTITSWCTGSWIRSRGRNQGRAGRCACAKGAGRSTRSSLRNWPAQAVYSVDGAASALLGTLRGGLWSNELQPDPPHPGAAGVRAGDVDVALVANLA